VSGRGNLHSRRHGRLSLPLDPRRRNGVILWGNAKHGHRSRGGPLKRSIRLTTTRHSTPARQLLGVLAPAIAGLFVLSCGDSSNDPPVGDDPGPGAEAPAIERPASSLHVHIHASEPPGITALNLIIDQYETVDALVEPIARVLRPATHPIWQVNDDGCSEWTYRPSTGCPHLWTVCRPDSNEFRWTVDWQDCTSSSGGSSLLLEATANAAGTAGTLWRHAVPEFDERRGDAAGGPLLGWTWEKDAPGIYGSYEIFDPSVSAIEPIARFSRVIAENGHEVMHFEHRGVSRFDLDSTGFEQDGYMEIFDWQDPGTWIRRHRITWTAQETGSWITYDEAGNPTESRTW